MASDFELAAEELLLAEELSFLTRGRSMRPLFREHKDVVNIHTVNRELKKGDVILYSDISCRNMVLHRIIKVKGDDLIIRGDNNFFIEHRKKDEIFGVLISFYRGGRYCDIKKSTTYKLYVFWILHSYPLRFLWARIVYPGLRKIKRTILRQPPVK